MSALGRPAEYQPAKRLVPIFAASEGLRDAALVLALAKAASARGETVLMMDAQGGNLMDVAGIIYHKTLGDLLYRGAEITDVKYVTSNEHFTAMACGDAQLDDVLGSLAALSLSYDWVFVAPPNGCTAAHTRLAAAADISLMAYSTGADRFMRAYWMMDAIRARAPKFDTLMLSAGPKVKAPETAVMLSETIREFLGAPPDYAGHIDDPNIITRLLGQMRVVSKARQAA